MKGQPESVASLVAAAAGLLKGASSFSISTKVPKEWMSEEEGRFDRKLIGSESVKSSLNRKLSSALSEASGLPYEADGDIRIVFDFTGEKAEVGTERVPVFVFGRYKKLVPGLSQSRWMCSDCDGKGCPRCRGKGKNYESVEERIGDVMKTHFSAQDYTMHASGREDVDATNIAGRPFVMEIKNPMNRKSDLAKIKNEIDSGKEVSVDSLAMVPRSFTELVTESHFDKEYGANVEFERDVGESELHKLEALAGTVLEQQTPERVAHRRADLVRKRKVIELTLVKTLDPRHAAFRIHAEAGTYIKELVSGDSGRTKPSFAGILGFSAKCTKLAVTRIDDGYLDTCMPG